MKKLGERVLPEIIPILEKGLDSQEADQRQGVCIGLSEIMSSTSRDHVRNYSLHCNFKLLVIITSKFWRLEVI